LVVSTNLTRFPCVGVFSKWFAKIWLYDSL